MALAGWSIGRLGRLWGLSSTCCYCRSAPAWIASTLVVFALGCTNGGAEARDGATASSVDTEPDAAELEGDTGAPDQTVAQPSDATSAVADIAVDTPSQDAAATPCNTSADCGDTTPYCRVASHQCVNCLGDGDCSEAEWCQQNVCVADTCKAGTTACTSAVALNTCAKNGSQWTKTLCPTKLICSKGACQQVICDAGALRCSGLQAEKCAVGGTEWLKTSDCSAATLACKDGACVPPVCTAGATQCSDDNVLTCKADWLGWGAPAPCPPYTSCAGGSCQPWTCSPNALTCKGQVAAECSADGLTASAVDCSKDGKICKDGQCWTPVCSPSSGQCVSETALKLCAADGMSWGELALCPPSTTCSQGNCVAWSCEPNQLKCEGNSVSQCAADGLTKASTDCAQDGKVCSQGKCEPAVCKPGEVKCEGTTSFQCPSPGIAWSVVDCDDKNACTQDSCDPASGLCVQAPLVCNDGKVCTADNCNADKGCVNTPLSGGCDDGSACTVGEACDSKSNCKASNLASLSLLAGKPVKGPSTDGKGQLAGFAMASSVTRWKGSSWLVTDDHYLRIVAEDGTVTTLAGSENYDLADGKGSNTYISSAGAVAGDGNGSAVFADSQSILRKVTADGAVTTLGGLLGPGYTDGPVAKARFGAIASLAWDGAGNLWIADQKNHRLRRMTPAGLVETMAGTGESDYLDGPALQAKIASPRGIAVASDGGVYFGTATRLRAWSLGNVTTIAGGDLAGNQDGAVSIAQFGSIYSIAAHPNGLLWLTDNTGHTVRSVDVKAGQVANVVGSQIGQLDGQGPAAMLAFPTGLAIDLRGRGAVIDGGTLVRSIKAATVVCNDGNPCTTDACDSATGGCKAVPLANGVTCSDGNACTAGESCDAGAICKGGKAKVCDDGDPCTEEQCDAWTGACGFAGSIAPCLGAEKCAVHACSLGKCLASQAEFATLAGTPKGGWLDGKGKGVGFAYASGLALAPDGALWTADFYAHKIRRIAPDGTASTVAGFSGQAGSVDGPASVASFAEPCAIAVDRGGLVYVAERLNHRIRRITPGGMVSTLAGSSAGYANGTGAAAMFFQPQYIALDTKGNLYVADTGNYRIRKVTPSGIVTTVAGNGAYYYQAGPAMSASFGSPLGLAVDSDGNLLVATGPDLVIAHIDLGKGIVSTLAGGSGTPGADGPVNTAGFHSPELIAVTKSGIVVFDDTSKRLRLIAGGKVTTFAGLGSAADEGPIDTAALGDVTGLAVDAKGRLAFAQPTRIRYITETEVHCDDGSPCTAESCNPATGNCVVILAAEASPCSDGNACTTGDACDAKGACAGIAKSCSDGNSCTEDLCHPGTGLCENSSLKATCTDGSSCTPVDLCVAGQCHSDLSILTTIAGAKGSGFANGKGTQALFGSVTAAIWLPAGDIAVTDGPNHAIRLVKPDGTVTTLCGGNGKGATNGVCGQAKFNSPSAIARSANGNLYIADTGNHQIRVITPAGEVGTLAGSGSASFKDGPGNTAAFSSPVAVAIGPDGALAVADSGNRRLRKVAMDGSVSTLAGSGFLGKHDGTASSATFSNNIQDLAYDTLGRLWIADTGNMAVRRLDDEKTVVTVAVGTGKYGTSPEAPALFGTVSALTVAPSGVVYLTDSYGGGVYWLAPTGQVGALLGSSSTPTDGSSVKTELGSPGPIAWAPDGRLLIGTGTRLGLIKLPSVDCDDGQPCTLDACDKGSGLCSHLAVSEGAPCSTGDQCTVKATCSQGICGKGQPQNCDDGNPCTDDGCAVSTGCSNALAAHGKPCGPGAACSSGVCATADCLTPVAQAGKYVGAPVTMETYGLGGGYSPTYHEYWYPKADTVEIHRYDANYKPIGVFKGSSFITTQLWGDGDDTYYLATMTMGSFQCSFSKYLGTTDKSLWSYKTSEPCGGVAADGDYVYAMGYKTMLVWLLHKGTGALVKTLTLQGGSSGAISGTLAVAGDSLFVSRSSNTVYRYDKTTGTLLDSFQTAVTPLNMAFDGKNYCVSATGNQVYCYTIAAAPPGCP